MHDPDIVYGIGAAGPDPSGPAAVADRLPGVRGADAAGAREAAEAGLVAAGPGFARGFGSAVPTAPATVRRALRQIEDGALDRGSVGELAAALGVGERHLRRLFARYLGKSPIAFAQQRRLREARRLICGSDCSMAEIALAAGYRSVRRFNAAFRARYGCSPGDLRHRRGRELP